MGKKSEPIISNCKAGENWTKVTFKPDLAKFNMIHLEDDVVALMKKRVFDVAGCLGKTVKVELNGERVPISSFEDYCKLYLESVSEAALPRIVEKVNERWEVCVSMSEGQFQQVSFVNAIATIKGGTHVDYVTNQIANHLIEVVNKKRKKKAATLKPHNVKNHLWVFVNSLIDNPAFDSQTKETLTLRQSSFGSKCELSKEFLDKVAKSPIVEALMSWADYKENRELKKTDGTKKEKLYGLPKLDDANEAGGRNSDKCTLILTEGDSAKALALAGISVVGRERYGVFPLRGKLLNVREATTKQFNDNPEITCIKRILGLQQGKQYDNVKSLRYGHLMIMTDQDHDGSHIKGLLINFIHTYWPSLLKVPSFLVEFITPIVKATHTSGQKRAFYTMPEYEAWKESLGGKANGWSIKYYKGLGTSTSEEGEEYFRDLDKHRKDFVWEDDQDGDAIELAFSKKKIEARKNWLRQFKPGTYLDQKEKHIKYRDFINKELILFSVADLQRSIPSMVDGLKPGQRKILFCSFKRNFVKEAKVAQFSGYVSEHSAYHHGEQSLASTIIGMAQDFVGSNNINLLEPIGQFGTRTQGGKDHASARYIYTRLSPITRYLFPKEDDMLLDYLNEDGQSIEPTWYVPIIPLVLVNGSEGIGTGWSSFIPNYNPREIISNVKRLLNNEPMEPMDPWYRGFIGTIEKTATKEAGVSYTVNGIIEEVNETTLLVSELPIRKWKQDYKAFLESISASNKDAKDPFIEGFTDNDPKNVGYVISITEESMMAARQEGLLKKFKLTTTISTSNMHLFNSNGVIKKYDTPEQILAEFYNIRLEFYEERKKVLLANLERELLKLANKVRFILGVVEGEIIVSNRKRADLFLELKEKGFTPFPKKTKTVEVAVAGATEDAEEDEDNAEVATASGIHASDYDYLISMAIGSLTLEKINELLAERDKLNQQVEDMKKATVKSLWMKDLDALETKLDEMDKIRLQKAKDEEKMIKGKRADAAKTRLAPKNQHRNKKNESKTNPPADPMEVSENSVIEKDDAPKAKQPNGRAAAQKKAPAKKGKSVSTEDDENDTILPLEERIAAFRIDSSPDNSAAMEMEEPQLETKNKGPSRRGNAQKNVTVIESDEEINISDGDEDFEMEAVAVQEKKKGGGRKPANGKAAKPPAGTKKRGAAASKQSQLISQKLITEVLKPTSDSPEKKVRKMRVSPFNKKSGSVLGRISSDDKEEENSPTSGSTEESMEAVVVPRARPQRANRGKTTYVLSDSESDAGNDSEFNDDEAENDSDFNGDD